jgi:hypothetical protein
LPLILWQRSSPLAFHKRNVGAIEKSIDVHVFAEIETGYGISRLALGLSNISRIDEMDLRLDILKAKNWRVVFFGFFVGRTCRGQANIGYWLR